MRFAEILFTIKLGVVEKPKLLISLRKINGSVS